MTVLFCDRLEGGVLLSLFFFVCGVFSSSIKASCFHLQTPVPVSAIGWPCHHRNICAPQVDNADLVFHSNAVKAVHFSPSGRYLCSGGVDCMLIVWDLQTGKKVTASVPKFCLDGVGVYSPQRCSILFLYLFLDL